MATYKPGDWIPTHDYVGRAKASYIVGAFSLAQFEREIERAIRGWHTFSLPYGSELRDRLLVRVDS